MMDDQEVKVYIRNYLKLKGSITILKHCRERMTQRNVTIDDMLYVLNWGRITDLRWDDARQNYKCRVEGADIDGDDLVFIAAIDTDRNEVICVTIF
jgi:hypothetical protein